MSGKRKTAVIALVAVLLALLCQSGNRLNEITIVQGAGFDYSDAGVTVTVQYLDLDKGTGKSDGIAGNITAVASASGKDAEEAVANLQHRLPHTIYLSQCKLVLIGGSYRKADLDALCRMMIEASELRLDTAVAGSDNAQRVLEGEQQNANVPAEAVMQLLQREGKTISINQLLGQYQKGMYAPFPVM